MKNLLNALLVALYANDVAKIRAAYVAICADIHFPAIAETHGDLFAAAVVAIGE